MKHRAHISLPIAASAMLLLASAAGAQTDVSEFETSLDPGYGVTPAPEPEPAKPELRGKISVGDISGKTVPISHINFVGTDVPENVSQAAESFLGRPADIKTFKALADVMTKAYQVSPVALFSLAIPNQNITDGTIDVFVAEGHLNKLVIKENGELKERPLLRGYLEAPFSEKPTKRSSYERGLSLATRIPGVETEPKLTSSSEPSTLNILLETKPRKRKIYAGYDSRESRLLDGGRVSAGGTFYNNILYGDELRGHILATPDFEQSRLAEIAYRAPARSNGTLAEVAAVYQQTRPSSIIVEGEATRIVGAVSHPLLIDFRKQILLNARVDHSRITNAAFGSVFASDRLTAARLGLSGQKTSESRAIAGDMTFSKGLSAAGAETATPQAIPDFQKLSASTRYVQKLGKQGLLRLSATGQWADDVLPASERFLIGGTQYGRGFENGLVALDQGYAASIEPAWKPLTDGPLKASEIYVFGDYGGGSINAIGSLLDNVTMGSAGFGARIAWKKTASIGLEFAQPFDQPVTGLSDDPIISVSWAFKYQPGDT